MEPFNFDKITKFLSYFPEIQVTCPFFGSNDNIVTLGEQVFVQAVELPDVPFDPVPLRSVPCLFAGGYPKSPSTQAVLHGNDHEMSGVVSFAQSI